MNMEADVAGPQRTVVESRVAPLRRSHGEWGIATRSGKTLPFKVNRMWSAPAGHYPEQWFLVNPGSREVLYEGPLEERMIWGLQSPTEVTDEVTDEIALDPGVYLVVFALGGILGGQAEVHAYEAPLDQAA